MAWAAVLLLAVSGGVLWRAFESRLDETVRTGGSAREIGLLAPANEASSSRLGAFAWRPAAGALRYSVDVVSPNGTSVYAAVVTDTTMVLPDSVRLSAGEYRWWVEAWLNDGTQARSAVRRLRIVNP
jgi:hypothetical protein